MSLSKSAWPSGASMNWLNSWEPGSQCMSAEKASRTHQRSPGSWRLAGDTQRSDQVKPIIVGLSVESPSVTVCSNRSQEPNGRA